jgi:hypothetical protein
MIAMKMESRPILYATLLKLLNRPKTHWGLNRRKTTSGLSLADDEIETMRQVVGERF